MFERDLDNESEDRRERLRFWLTVGLGAILTGVVGALVLLLSRANDDYDRSLGWQAHSLEIISQTRSLDAALARAEQAGGRIATPRTELPDGLGVFAHILDLDGNRVGVHAMA